MKKIISRLMFSMLAAVMLCGCASKNEAATVTVFAAKSLNTVMDELISIYVQENPGVTINTNYDSSGTLQTQIEEGASCDVFFSAAQKQMDALEKEGLIEAGTRANIVNNQVCLVAAKGSATKVTGLADIEKAESVALAGGSVPVGKYTRVALVNMGKVGKNENPSEITTQEISDALNGVTINECANVGAVAVAVAEGANEVGTVYYSDYKGYEDRMDIIEIVPYDLTGDVIYPLAQIVNKEASERDKKAAADFISFLKSDRAKEVFEKYYFDTNVN